MSQPSVIPDKSVVHDGMTISSDQEHVTLLVKTREAFTRELKLTHAEFLKLYDNIGHLISWDH
jgi:hypothetical protein